MFCRDGTPRVTETDPNYYRQWIAGLVPGASIIELIYATPSLSRFFSTGSYCEHFYKNLR